MKNNIFFNYSSTAKIRILKKNCYFNNDFPDIFRIKTEKLDFVIPRKATIFVNEHVFIPMEFYRMVLIQYYAKKSKGAIGIK